MTAGRVEGPAGRVEGPAGRVEGKVALVTGAGRGIGRAIALALHAEGAVVAAAARTGTEVAATAEACGPGALALTLDVTDEEACARAVQRCQDELGPIDVLVNNAGMAASSPFLQTSTELWRQHLTTNVDSAFWLVRAALPGMLARGSGAVVSVASVSARVGRPYVAAYTASKHALLGLTRALAAEYARSGVTFNCVCPAYVDTPMTQAAVDNIVARTGRTPDEALAALLTPQGRLIQPEEVAAVCVLLASEAGRSITGQAIDVDGGTLQP